VCAAERPSVNLALPGLPRAYRRQRGPSQGRYGMRPRPAYAPAHVIAHVMRCRICPCLIKSDACGAAARRQRRPPALGRPRPSHAGRHLRSPQIKAAHTACIGAPRGRLPRCPSVQLAVVASRAPLGRRQGRSAFADPGPGTHSHGIGACEDDGQEQDWLEPSLRCRCLQGRWNRCRDGPAVTLFLGRGRVSSGWQAGAPLVYTAAGTRPSFGSIYY